MRRHFLWFLVLGSSIAVTFASKEDETTAPSSIYETIERDIRIASDTLEYHKERITSDFASATETLIEQKDRFLRDVERASEQFEERRELMVKDVYDQLEVAQTYAKKCSDCFYRTVRQSQRRFREQVLSSVLQQRVGWNRLRRNTRDFVGLIIGGCMVFTGYTNPHLANGDAIALQVSQLSWDILDAHHLLPHEPWLYDAIAIIIGLVSRRELPATRFSKWLPSIFLNILLFHSVGLAVEEWNADKDLAKTQYLTYTLLATGLAYLALKVSDTPIPLASSSASGAFLVCASARAEIAGNWFYMAKLVSSLLYRMMPPTRQVLNVAGRGILRLWRKRKSALWPRKEPSKTALGRFVARVRGTYKTYVEQSLNSLQSLIHDRQMSQALQDFAKRLQQAFRPIAWPWFIAAWGVAIQMKYVRGPETALRMFRVAMNPVSAVLNRIERLFDVKLYARKALGRAVVRIRAVIKRANNNNNRKG